MKIPNFIDEKFIDKDGSLTKSWKQILTELFSELQSNLSNEGHVVPQQGTTDIATLFSDPEKSGSLLYDKDTNQLKVNINGTVKIIQVA